MYTYWLRPERYIALSRSHGICLGSVQQRNIKRLFYICTAKDVTFVKCKSKFEGEPAQLHKHFQSKKMLDETFKYASIVFLFFFKLFYLLTLHESASGQDFLSERAQLTFLPHKWKLFTKKFSFASKRTK